MAAPARSPRNGVRVARSARWRCAALYLFLLGCLVARGAVAQTYSVLHSFTVPPGAPKVGLILGTDGNYYGTTSLGGGNSAGSVFKMTSAGVVTVLHTFSGDDGANPQGSLLLAADGNFYGTTTTGGSTGNGTVYRVDSSGNFTLLHSFTPATDGASPYGALVQGTDGNFYGTTSGDNVTTLGTVFKMTSAGIVTTLHNFTGGDGDFPYAGLIQASDGKFYGTTSGGGSGIVGTVFRWDPVGGFATLHNFTGTGTDGAGPRARLLQASDGKLYGTTSGGGSSANGTVFQITTAGGFATIHSFTGTGSEGATPSAPLLQGSDGKLYGTTEVGGLNGLGTVFKIDPTGSPFATLYGFAGSDGKLPISSVLPDNSGNLYGTTQAGGSLDGGTAFRLVISSGSLSTLHTFGGEGSGYEPSAPVVQGADGAFYGTTYRGGSANLGTVYKVDSAGNFTLLHEFAGQPADGGNPAAGLVLASDGNFYGATVMGGTGDLGTVFRMTPAGTVTILHSFADTDGTGPTGSLVQASDGKLYGTTQYGGANNLGELYRVDTSSTGNFLAIHSFAASEASYPAGYLIQAPDGSLYGVSWAGGATANGNAFKTTTAGVVTSLHDFNGADGMFPFGGLVRATDGNFYGTTRSDSGTGAGTLFRMTSAGVVTTIHFFLVLDGSGPLDGLIQGADGKLYGTTYDGGTYGKGTVFSSTLAGVVTTLHSLTGPDGNGAAARVMQASNGKLYGTANRGGDGAAGVLFQVGLSTCTPPVVTASSNSPVCAGGTLHLMASTVAGATYAWTGPNSFTSTSQSPICSSVTAAAAGTYSVTATVSGCTSAPATTIVVVNAPPSATITAPSAVCPLSTGNAASVPDAGPGATYAWSITNGTITSGAGSKAIVFTAGSTGSVQLSVTVTAATGCAATGSASVTLRCLAFYPIPPCRVLDTRNPNGPLGGPSLAAGATRTFVLTGSCGVPTTARVVSINLTVTGATSGPASLLVYPAGTTRPLASTISYSAGQTRANNWMALLGASGDVAISCGQTTGTVNAIVDVNGYFK